MGNEGKHILDLCGGSGNWSKPYKDAGYTVHLIDIKNGQDARLFEIPDYEVYGILAAPVCTMFCIAGAWVPRTEEEIIGALSLVDACLRIILMTEPKFWALENPVGKLSRWLGPPQLTFQPYEYGDPYTKRTCLWGVFNGPTKTPVQPLGGYQPIASLGGKSKDRQAIRSLTPAGFARAFFLANQ